MFIIRRCFIAALALVAATASAQPDAEAILGRALTASGGAAAWGQAVALESRGRLVAGGQTGSFGAVEDLEGGRYVGTFELGALEGGQGFDGTTAWVRRPGGDVSALDAPAALSAALDQAWLAARAYWFPDRRAGAVRYSRRAEEAGRACDVIEAEPQGGGKLELWFDAGTGLLARIDSTDTSGPLTELLSDYRVVDGLEVPYRRVQRRGDERYDFEMVLDEVKVSRSVEPAAFAMPEGRPHDFRFAADARSAALPFELDSNHIYLEVRVNGRPLRFMFDSGGVNLLSRSAADALGLESQGEIQGQGAGEQSMPISVVNVHALALGDVVLEDQTFFVAPIDALAKAHGKRFDGLVGYEILRRFVVEIDYAGRRLVLRDSESFAYEGSAAPLRVRFADRVPIVQGAIDGIEGDFSLDTGARNSVTLTSPFAARHDLAGKYAAGPERIVGWGVGGAVMAHVGRARTLSLGRARIDWPVVEIYTGEHGALADESLAGNVGGGALRRFKVTFDYGRRQVYLEPNADHDTPDLFDRSGLALAIEGTDIVVAGVAPDSPAMRAGLEKGDRLRALDDRTLAPQSLHDLRRQLIERPAGTELGLEYERAGRAAAAALVLEDLLPPDPRERDAARSARSEWRDSRG
jgi:Aspartyl protease/PDZ domain